MRKLFTLAAATLLATSAFAAGEVYRWKDANNTWHYSDQPQPGAEMVRGTRRPVPADNEPAPLVARPVPTAATPPPLPAVTTEVAKSVRDDAAKAKVEQCKKADEAYTKAIQARRIYKTDEKGNRTFLTDAEVDANRLEARSIRDLACGP